MTCLTVIITGLVLIQLVNCHLTAKRTATFGISLQCTPHWNESHDTFSVHINWTVTSSNNVAHFYVDYYEIYTSTASSVTGSAKELFHVTQIAAGQTSFTRVDLNKSPLPIDRLGVYEILTYWKTPSSANGHAKQNVSLTPPIPPVPYNVTLLSHDITSHNLSHSIIVLVKDIQISWTMPEIVRSSLNYYACIENVLCSQIHNVTKIDNTTVIGRIAKPGTLVLGSHAKLMHLKCHSSYTVNSVNVTVNSTWSQPVDIMILPSLTTSFTTSGILPTISDLTTTTTTDIVTTTAASNYISNTINSTFTSSNTFIISSTFTSSSFTSSSISNDTNDMSLYPTAAAPIESKSSKTGYIVAAVMMSIIVILIIIVIVVSLMALIVSKNRQKFKEISDYLEHDDTDMIAIFQSNTNRTISIANEPQTDEWEIPIEAIQFDQLLGEGCFGEVFLGSLTEQFNNQSLRQTTEGTTKGFVAIKILKSTATQSEKSDFLKEIELMKKISQGKNPRVVNMIGAVTIQEPMILVTEFIIHGDLLTYLRACRKKKVFHRGGAEPAECQFNENDLVSFAYQITSGMEYLSSLQVVHRDLACRNILVGEGKSLKITDFGLSRMIYNDSAYVKTTKGKLPLKWMSIESIIDRVFTTSSDVWSFGICLWEIATLGHTPYPTVSNEELLPMLMQGHRMDKPNTCSDEIYDIMIWCWQEDPNERPTFVELRKKFDIILSRQQNFTEHYIDLSATGLSSGADDGKESNESIKCTEEEEEQLYNVYVDSPTHDNKRPHSLMITDNEVTLKRHDNTPGGISLPTDFK